MIGKRGGKSSRSSVRAAGIARPRSGLAAMLTVMAATVAGCNSAGPVSRPGMGGDRMRVVAAENFWGSIATQLGGDRVSVSSIVVNPSSDPHSYEPTARDARALARARLAIVNGVGYDGWASKLLAASAASSARAVVNVGDALGLKEGDNPHQWYSPASVYRVVGAIVAAYDRLDPAGAAYFAARRGSFETEGLARYNLLRHAIRARYAGVPVGYSESVFRPLGEDLGLKLVTPYGFAKAIAEGGEPTAQDRQAVEAQARERQVEVWVVNSQNVTPDVQRVSEIARARQIPIATVTETLSPAASTFEQWQVAEMEGLERALARATGGKR